jgi:hypothetical protein
MNAPARSPAKDPLSPEFFLRGREIVRTPWPYETPAQVTGDIVRSLSALSSVSPLLLRLCIAQLVADSVTAKNNSTLVDLLKAIGIIQHILTNKGLHIPSDLTINPGESELAFALRKAINQIATGESQVVAPTDMEEFDRTMSEMMEQALRYTKNLPM